MVCAFGASLQSIMSAEDYKSNIIILELMTLTSILLRLIKLGGGDAAPPKELPDRFGH